MTNIESTVCFFRDLHKTLQAISNEDAGILMKALFAHANGEEPVLDGSVIAKALYIGIADQVDRLDAFRKSKKDAGRLGGIMSGQTRSKMKQNEANVKQTEAKWSNAEQNEPPYPNPYPDIYKGIQRNPKVQRSMGFSTERTDVDYNEIARRMREEREAAE